MAIRYEPNMVMNDGMTIGVGDSYHTKYWFASYTLRTGWWLTTLTLWSKYLWRW